MALLISAMSTVPNHRSTVCPLGRSNNQPCTAPAESAPQRRRSGETAPPLVFKRWMKVAFASSFQFGTCERYFLQNTPMPSCSAAVLE